MKNIRLFKDTFIYGLGDIGAKLVGFLLIPIYTRYLSSDDYGDYSLWLTYQSIFAAFLSLQLVEGVYRYLLDEKYNKSKIINASFIMITIPILIFLTLAFFISNGKYLIIGLYFAFYVYIQFFKQVVRGLKKINLFSISSVIAVLTSSLISIYYVITLNSGYIGIIYGSICGYILTTIFIVIKIRNDISLSFYRIPYSLFKKLLLFSIPLIPSALSWWVMSLSDRLLIDYYVGKAPLGIYSIALSISGVILLFNSMFQKAWQTSAIENYNDVNNEKNYNEVFDFILRGFLIVISLFTLLIKPLSFIVLGKEFFEAWIYAPILSIAFMFQLFGSFIGTYYWSSKKIKGELYTSILAALINIVLNFLLIPFFGLMGASIATVLAYFALWLIRVYSLRKSILLSINYKLLFTCLLAIVSIHLLNIVTLEISNFYKYIIISLIELYVLYINRNIIIKLYLTIKKRISSISE
ncbi:oligosaccharide flippase family protein [Aquimarina muelleri]|uniref:oligosaccharide flippase family protein n=1 Tax=Aquimarina muelleri TaxID=279356 RepID=UPI003F68396F